MTRQAARLIMVDGEGRVLLLHAQEPNSTLRLWAMPGGGLQDGEDFPTAALREGLEETGLVFELGPCVWTRRHRFLWDGRQMDQYERFFVARVTHGAITPSLPDDDVIGHRWWTLEEITKSSELFTPRKLATLLDAILRGEYPKQPFDCGT
jgi:ADP-ribose pyrophosphatase YjhB (NUDIX family)